MAEEKMSFVEKHSEEGETRKLAKVEQKNSSQQPQ
jgi:hypothetical protein